MSSVQPRSSIDFYHLDVLGHVAKIGLSELANLRDSSTSAESERIHDSHLNRGAAVGIYPLMAEKALGGGLLIKSNASDALRLSDELFGIPSAPVAAKSVSVVKVQADVTYDPALKAMMLDNFGSAANGEIRLPFANLAQQFAPVASRVGNVVNIEFATREQMALAA